MFFAERWRWPPTVVDEQPLRFVRYAPVVVSAFDAIERERQEAEQRKQKTKDAAGRTGPRFGG